MSRIGSTLLTHNKPGQTPDLEVSFGNWLHLSWSEMEYHPMMLNDWPALQASPAHFAHKLNSDACADLYDQVRLISHADLQGYGHDSSHRNL